MNRRTNGALIDRGANDGAAGSDDFIPKPVQAFELLSKLKNYLGLEWVYEADAGDIFSETQENMLIIMPPIEELAAAKEAASLGKIKVVEREARRLCKLDEQYVAFGERLLELAWKFECKEIETILGLGDPPAAAGSMESINRIAEG